MLHCASSDRRSRRAFWLLTAVVFIADPSATALAQEPQLFRAAERELAAGDTLAALARLRALTEQQPDYAPGWGLLGEILTERANSKETNFRMRAEADEALRKAWSLDPRNPSYLMTLGKLMRKQQMYFDARRVLNRAKNAIIENPDEITPEERAQLWYELGLHAEDIYLDTRHLVFVPNLPVYTPECGTLGDFCLNFTRPKLFNDFFRYATDISDEGDDDYEEMTEAFQRALDSDPTHAGAFRRLAVHLIEQGVYDEARMLARSFVDEAPDSPWGYYTLGLVCYRTGLDSLAEAYFDRGISLSDPEIADHYQDVSSLLRENQAERYVGANAEARRSLEQILWRKSDPLYLTPGNEIRVAHLARVSFADIWFEDPAAGRWGADTEQGQIYVRYGPPERIWQVHRDRSREASGEAGSRAQGGGRWIFWNYDWELPNFIFEKQLRYRAASHMLSSASKFAEEEARQVEPAVYSTNFELFDYPAQVARFRGASDTIVEVDLYSDIPAHELLDRPDTLDVGLFLFAGGEHFEVFRRTLQVPASPEPTALTYSLPLPQGRFSYSLEAQASEYRAAVGRGEFETVPFRDGALAMSDLVLAGSVSPRTAEPTGRRGFAIKVNRSAVFDRDLPVAAYWEVYGLATDAEGFANFTVTLTVTDAEGKGVLARVADAFGFGEGDEIELTYDRIVQFNGERVPEYMSIELLDSDAGTYKLTIEIVDNIGDRRIAGERTFRLVAID